MDSQHSRRKPYQQQMATNWWLTNSAYRHHMLRTATCIFVIFYALILFWGLTALSAGEQEFNQWLASQQSPIFILLHGIGLIAMLYHTKTWFGLAPKTIHLQIGATKVSDKRIEAVLWFAWLVVTFVLLAILLG